MTEVQWIFKVVDDFYSVAKSDILIGYHFRNIPDFEEHIPRIASFWELQLLGKSSRKIDPPFDVMKVHVPLGIKRGELGRWMVLFKKSLEKNLSDFPEMRELGEDWLTKLQHFEGIFLRFFGF